jgi:hypothetical protein
MTYSPFVETLKTSPLRQTRRVTEREMLRIAGTLGDHGGGDAAELARSEILTWAEKRSAGSLPQAAWLHQGFEYLAGGRNCVGVRLVSGASDIWALRADDPDKTVAQRVWSTEVVIGQTGRAPPKFSVRLLVSSPEPELDLLPHVPGLLHRLEATCGIEFAGQGFFSDAWRIRSAEDAHALVDLLLDPARMQPVFVFTHHERDEDFPLLERDADALARATLGLAHTVILPVALSWYLTERFGRFLSVFNGAARIYLPGFTEDADPYAGHRLITRDRFASFDPFAFFHRVAASDSLARLKLGRDIPEFSSIRTATLTNLQAYLEHSGADEQDIISSLKQQKELLEKELGDARELQAYFGEEHTREKLRAEAAETQLAAANTRIQHLLAAVRKAGGDPYADVPLPVCWNDFGDWCEQHLSGRVTLTKRARREVRDAMFADIAQAARCVMWLANFYRDTKLNGAGMTLRDYAVEPGIWNSPCGADEFPVGWRGQNRVADWHIKTGGNKRDPIRALRIYYFWDAASSQVVIASMPGHASTGAS